MNQTLQSLLEQFLRSLQHRAFEQCQQFIENIENLQPLAEDDSAAIQLKRYFQGLLANEQEHDTVKAEEIFTSLLADEPDADMEIRVLLALGPTYHYQSRWLEAIEIFRKVEIRYGALNRVIDQAKALKNIAVTCEKGYSCGDLSLEHLIEAEQSCQRAIQLLETKVELTASDEWLAATTWSILGVIFKHQQRWQSAIRCHQFRLQYALTHQDRFGEGVAKGNQGEIYQLQGVETWEKALDAYQSSLTIFRELKEHYDAIEVLANLASLSQAMDEDTKALSYYQEAIDLAEYLRSANTNDVGRAGFFATVDSIYTNAILLLIQQNQLQRAFTLTEQARARAFLDSIAMRSGNLTSRIYEPLLSAEQIQAKLRGDECILAYFTSGLLEPQVDGNDYQATIPRHRFPHEKTFLFIIGRTTLQIFDLEISPNLLRPNHLTTVVERHFLQREIRYKLYQLLIQPVEKMIENYRILYLLPHGPLHYIPFQALIAADGDTLLREEGPQLIHIPSATLFFHKARQKKNPLQQPTLYTSHQSALVVGYNGEGKYKLQNAEAEAQTIAAQLQGKLILGKELKKEQLFSIAANYRWLHISCHGTFNPESPLTSALMLAQDETLTSLEILQSLRLNAQLVTLSACESGLSRIRRGDELTGLLRSFFFAGASTVVASLWRVDEDSTHLLMHHFYQQLSDGSTIAEALKAAQLMLKKHSSFQDPFYWAAFVPFYCDSSSI